MIKNIFFLILILHSCLQSMDPDFEKKVYEEIPQEEVKINLEENSSVAKTKFILNNVEGPGEQPENQNDLVKKFVKNDFENFIFLAKVLNRKNVPIVIRNKILHFLYLNYPSKLNMTLSEPGTGKGIFVDSIYSLCKFNERFLISGYYSGKIKIWDLKKRKLHKKFFAQGGLGIVALLKMKDNIFISLSSTESNPNDSFYTKTAIVKVWNINSFACLNTIRTQFGGTLSLFWRPSCLFKITDELFLVGDNPNRYWVRSIYTGEIQNDTFQHLQPKITNMLEPKISPEDLKEIREMECDETYAPHKFIYLENHLIFTNITRLIGEKQKLKVFNLQTKRYDKIYLENVEFLLGINDFVFASKDRRGKIKIWNIKKDEYLLEINPPYEDFTFFLRGGSGINTFVNLANDSIATGSRSYDTDIEVYGPSLDVKSQPEPIPECCTIL